MNKLPGNSFSEPVIGLNLQSIAQNFDCATLKSAPSLMNIVQRAMLWSLIAGIAPRSYLEIGTARGGSALIVNDAVQQTGNRDFVGVCIDIRFDRMSEQDRAILEKRFHFIQMPLGTQSMQAAKRIVEKFDVVLIDALHDQDNATFDFLTVWPHVSPGGYILFDDANYFGVAEAIRSVLQLTTAIDCGKIVRCGGVGKAEPGPGWLAKPGPSGEPATWGGMHVLRKPA